MSASLSLSEHSYIYIAHGGDHQRTMSSRYELNVREVIRELLHDCALPARMNVQVDLINQHHGRLPKRIRAFWIPLDQFPGQINDPCGDGTVAET